MKKFLGITVSILAIIFILITLTGYNYIWKAVWYYTADLDDYKIFSNNTVAIGNPQPIPNSSSYKKVEVPATVNSVLEKTKSVALLVLKNDSVIIEKYWNGYSDTSYSNSFSVAKTIVGLLTACAIHDGFIDSLDQHVGDFIPEMNEGHFYKITIRSLLTMSSGTSWDESYGSPFSNTAEAYYGSDLYHTATSGLKCKQRPGTEWRYKSGDTELLGLVLEKATKKSLSEYASEKLWKPMGAQHEALWSTDKEGGREKAYCCFNTNARDYSRIGTLLLHHGNWNGTQLVDSAMVELFTSPLGIKDEINETANYYGYQLWILPDRSGVFYARGILGQYIIVIPQKNIVMVRLGLTRGEIVGHSFEEVYSLVDWALNDL